MVTKLMLAYGTPVIAGVTPGRGGQQVEGAPVYDTLRAACRAHALQTSIVYVPPGAVLDAIYEVVDNGIETVLIVTENIPYLDVVRLLKAVDEKGVRVLGPNSVGIISPGEKCKLGAIGGDNTERCFVPGPVGVISRSGGMTAETSWMVKRAGYGVSTSVSIGGDALIGSPPKELLALFEKDPATKVVVMYSEPGTNFEEEVAEYIEAGHFTKPLISFIGGNFTEDLPEGTVFGHAAAIIEGQSGRPSGKKKRLREAGAHVAEQFDDVIILLKKALG